MKVELSNGQVLQGEDLVVLVILKNQTVSSTTNKILYVDKYFSPEEKGKLRAASREIIPATYVYINLDEVVYLGLL